MILKEPFSYGWRESTKAKVKETFESENLVRETSYVASAQELSVFGEVLLLKTSFHLH